MIDLSLFSTGTAQPFAQEDEESLEEPNVAQHRQEKLSGRQTRSFIVAVHEVVDEGHDEERGEDWQHPNSGPEMNLSKAELLSQTETKQGDESDNTVIQSSKNHHLFMRMRFRVNTMFPKSDIFPAPEPIDDAEDSNEKVENITPDL